MADVTAVAAVSIGLAAGLVVSSIGPLRTGALAIIAAAVILLALSRPALGVMVYVASRPLADAFVGANIGPGSVGTLWGAGLLALEAAYVVGITIRSPERVRLSSPPLIFMGAYCIMTLVHPFTADSLVNITRIASVLLLILASQTMARTQRGRRLVMNTATAMAVCLVAVVLVEVVLDRYGAAKYWGSASDVVTQGPHGFAFLAVFLLPFALTGVLRGRHARLFAVLSVGLGVAVVLSYVRTAYVGAAFPLIAFLWLVARRGDAGRRVIAAVTAGLIAAAVFVSRSLILERWSDITAWLQTGTAPTDVGRRRLDIWGAVWQSWEGSISRVLAGVGSRSSYESVAARTGMSVYAHNDFLELLSTGGVILLAAYLWFLGWCFNTCRRASRALGSAGSLVAYPSLMAATVLSFVSMSFLNGVVFYQAALAFALGIGLCAGIADSAGKADERGGGDNSR